MREFLQAASVLINPIEQRYAVVEMNRGCRRRCSYCAVPAQWNPEKELDIYGHTRIIDWSYRQGYRAISFLGGEPLEESLYTKEGVSFFEHTLKVVNHAANKGMLISLSTNGDNFTQDKAKILRRAGLTGMTFSWHTLTRESLDRLIVNGRFAVQEGIVSSIQAVMTDKNVDIIPAAALYAAENGIFFSISIVQEKGGGFSVVPKKESSAPSLEQQKEVFKALLCLKKFGFVRNDRNFLLKAPAYSSKKWVCDPKKDYFIHFGAEGTVDVCQDVRTDLTIDDIDSLNDKKWRERKTALIENCAGCSYQCYHEPSDPDIKGDIATIGITVLMRMGRAGLVRRLGQFAASTSRRLEPEIDWEWY